MGHLRISSNYGQAVGDTILVHVGWSLGMVGDNLRRVRVGSKKTFFLRAGLVIFWGLENFG